MSTLQSVVKVEQRYGGSHQKRLLIEIGNTASMLNKDHDSGQYTKRSKGLEIKTMAIGVESRVEAHWDKPPEKEVIHTGRKVYRPQLPSTYKKTELSDDL